MQGTFENAQQVAIHLYLLCNPKTVLHVKTVCTCEASKQAASQPESCGENLEHTILAIDARLFY